MKIDFKFSIEIKRSKKREVEAEEEVHPEGNNFSSIENAYQESPSELKIGFARNDW